MLGSHYLNSVEISSRVDQLKHQLDLTKSIFEQRDSILDQRNSKRGIDGFGHIIQIRRQIIKQELEPVIRATIIDHSSQGCGLLLATKQRPKLQDIYQLNTVKFDSRIIVIVGKVVWSQILANDIYRIGIEYIDLVKA